MSEIITVTESRGTTAGLDSRGQRMNYCPFGCSLDDLDDMGYCRHLVGFTNDGKKYEMLCKHPVRGTPMVTGGNRGAALKAVLKTDKLVNPERRQIADGLDQMIKSWVSSRVYRENPEQTPTKPVG